MTGASTYSDFTERQATLFGLIHLVASRDAKVVGRYDVGLIGRSNGEGAFLDDVGRGFVVADVEAGLVTGALACPRGIHSVRHAALIVARDNEH